MEIRKLSIWVGLGNPGADYKKTRHNIGFLALDMIHQEYKFGPWKKKHSADIAQGTIDGNKILLMKPNTYMNLSGEAVFQVLNYFKEPISSLIVFHDDLTLASGKIKISEGSGSSGHNGLKSIDAIVGKMYTRVRIGIGYHRPQETISTYVLSCFSDDEKRINFILLENLARNVPFLLQGKTSQFMNNFL